MFNKIYDAIRQEDIVEYVAAFAANPLSGISINTVSFNIGGDIRGNRNISLLLPNVALPFNVGTEPSQVNFDPPTTVRVGFIDSVLYFGGQNDLVGVSQDAGAYIPASVPFVNLFLETGVDAIGMNYFTILIYKTDPNPANGIYFGSVIFESFSKLGGPVVTTELGMLSNYQTAERRDVSTLGENPVLQKELVNTVFPTVQGTFDTATAEPDEVGNIVVSRPLLTDIKTPKDVAFLVGENDASLVEGQTVTMDVGNGPQRYIFLQGAGNANPLSNYYFAPYNGILLKFFN